MNTATTPAELPPVKIPSKSKCLSILRRVWPTARFQRLDPLCLAIAGRIAGRETIFLTATAPDDAHVPNLPWIATTKAFEGLGYRLHLTENEKGERHFEVSPIDAKPEPLPGLDDGQVGTVTGRMSSTNCSAPSTCPECASPVGYEESKDVFFCTRARCEWFVFGGDEPCTFGEAPPGTLDADPNDT